MPPARRRCSRRRAGDPRPWDSIETMRAPLAYGLIAVAALVAAPRGAGCEPRPGRSRRASSASRGRLREAARAAADDAEERLSASGRRSRSGSCAPTPAVRSSPIASSTSRARSTAPGRNDLFRGFPSWSVDCPKADIQFMMGLKRLVTHLDAYDGENPVSLGGPRAAAVSRSSTRSRSDTCR